MTKPEGAAAGPIKIEDVTEAEAPVSRRGRIVRGVGTALGATSLTLLAACGPSVENGNVAMPSFSTAPDTSTAGAASNMPMQPNNSSTITSEIAPPTTTKAVLPAPFALPQGAKTYPEVEEFGANTFLSYKSNGSGMRGTSVAPQTEYDVLCIESDPAYWDVNMQGSTTDGLWYKLARDGSYAPANTFWNQPIPQSPDQQNVYDPYQTIPICPDSPSQQLPGLHS